MHRSGQIDKARPEHWDRIWQGAEMPPPVVVDSTSLNDYPARAFANFFTEIFARWPQPDSASTIELGCGRSVWLPFFATSFGFEVAGLDYSEAGCEQARVLLARDRVDGNIRHGDIFNPPPDMLGRYDLVISFGLVEHFSDTADCLRHCAAFARPGGMIVTMIPNMFGITGLLTRLINRPVFDIHVAMDATMLQTAHAAAGLHVLDTRYLMPINLNVVYPPASFPNVAKEVINHLFSWISKSVWLLDSRVLSVRAVPSFSPYLICVAKKPG